jgi:sulfopropanediol 3-dehydrogenase
LSTPGADATLRPAGLPPGFSATLVKAPARSPAPARDPAIVQRVSEMLLAIERGGVDAVRSLSEELDGWAPSTFEVSDAEVRAAADSLSDELKQAIAFAQEQIGGFARRQRETLVDFEVETLPGVRLGQRQIPVRRVGAYIPAGRVPMLATPFMTVLVAKVAGVQTVVACSPPRAARESIRPCSTRSRPPAPTASSRSAAYRRWRRWRSGSKDSSRST